VNFAIKYAYLFVIAVISQLEFELPRSLNLNCHRQRRPGEVEGRPKMTEKIQPRGCGGHFLGFLFLKETLAPLSTLDS
jgi:hypothetical protein